MICAPSVSRAPCPACRGPMVELVYQQTDAPASSNRVFRSREEAIECERGDISLALCHSCGFIANTAFEPWLASDDYETSQAASPRFRAYATDLAERWIERYGLRGQAVLEIGCARGEFLEWMREGGIRRGVGVDPVLAGVQERGCRPPDGVDWVADVFRPEHLDPDIRAIVCRHTLEHVPDSGDFVASVREAIGDRDIVVLFEVPDVLPILQHAAFWDIYYEHCAYFTEGSLSRLFTRAGFQVLRIERTYDNQYLTLEARPRRGAAALETPFPEDDRPRLWRAVTEFRRTHARQREHWQDLFASLASQGKRVALWGAGSKATAYLTALELGDRVECVVDINPRKHGTFIAGSGHPVVAPEQLPAYRPDVVVMMNDIYRDEITSIMRGLGVDAELIGTRQR